MNSALRDQRGRIYDYVTVSDSGYQAESYAYVAERWCRVGQPSGREATVAAQAQHRTDVVITFAADAPVTKDGLVRVDGQSYRVTFVPPPNRMLDELAVQGTHIDDANLTLTGEP